MSEMSKEDRFEKLYETLSNYEKQLHLQNQKRIKIGLRCLLIVPTGFLALLFLTNSNKIIFLILWIISLFGIAFYLIGVEYVDYQLQIKLNEWGEQEHAAVDHLIGIDLMDVGGNLKQALQDFEPKEVLREKIGKYRETLGKNEEPEEKE